ncbi:hypothetical protein EQV77_16710 [Halobacillus fulvus]|nr:hypothetical protein EQV77_16710 [Halobacillus fulvus]
MNRKWLIGGIIGAVVIGGGIGVSATTNGDDWNPDEENVSISLEEAESTAKEELEGLTVNKVERDRDDGRLVYEFDGNLENGQEVDIDIDANTGEVVKVDRDDDDNRQNGTSNQPQVSSDRAKEIANNEVDGEIVEFEYDDDGYYEVEMKDGTYEYELDIDDQSGDILNFEKDRDDDDDDDRDDD